MQITVQLAPTAAKRARARGTRSAGAVLSWLKHPLQPVHPTTRDANLATFFTVEVDDPEEASHLVERLLKDPSVEAAYIKPRDEPA